MEIIGIIAVFLVLCVLSCVAALSFFVYMNYSNVATIDENLTKAKELSKTNDNIIYDELNKNVSEMKNNIKTNTNTNNTQTTNINELLSGVNTLNSKLKTIEATASQYIYAPSALITLVRIKDGKQVGDSIDRACSINGYGSGSDYVVNIDDFVFNVKEAFKIDKLNSGESIAIKKIRVKKYTKTEYNKETKTNDKKKVETYLVPYVEEMNDISEISDKEKEQTDGFFNRMYTCGIMKTKTDKCKQQIQEQIDSKNYENASKQIYNADTVFNSYYGYVYVNSFSIIQDNKPIIDTEGKAQITNTITIKKELGNSQKLNKIINQTDNDKYLILTKKKYDEALESAKKYYDNVKSNHGDKWEDYVTVKTIEMPIYYYFTMDTTKSYILSFKDMPMRLISDREIETTETTKSS